MEATRDASSPRPSSTMLKRSAPIYFLLRAQVEIRSKYPSTISFPSGPVDLCAEPWP